jgi:DNA-cytosine methyltransferase
MPLTAVHLFCGAGLGTRGLQDSGIEVISGNDIDEKALWVHRHRFPNCKIIEGDICSYDSSVFPDVDIILGGSPCTDFSRIGKQSGVSGEVGRLTLEYVRVVREKQPKAILFENVMGFLSCNSGKDFLCFLSKLDAAGYSGCTGVISGTHWAPQMRDRIYLIAIRNDLLHLGTPSTDGNIKTLASIFAPLESPALSAIAYHYFWRLSAFREKTLTISSLQDDDPLPSLKFCAFSDGQLLSVDAEFENFAYCGATLQHVLERNGVAFIVRAAKSIRTYTKYAPTIRGMNWKEGVRYRQPGTGHMKIKLNTGEYRSVLPKEIERIMGEKADSTRYGLTQEGQSVELSGNERIKMLSMGMIPGAITDMATCIKGLLGA